MYQYSAKILKVVDGDTVHAEVDLGFDTKQKMTFRLLGLDAPETRTKDLEEKRRGNEVKEWLTKRIENRNVIVETKKDKKEKYGRYLAVVVDPQTMMDISVVIKDKFRDYFPEEKSEVLLK